MTARRPPARPMDAAQLDAITRRADAASDHAALRVLTIPRPIDVAVHAAWAVFGRAADAELCLHARQDILALAAEVVRLRARTHEIQERADRRLAQLERDLREQQALLRHNASAYTRVASGWSDAVEALSTIAHRPDAEMQQARTLHWDMRGWAREALDRLRQRATAAAEQQE